MQGQSSKSLVLVGHILPKISQGLAGRCLIWDSKIATLNLVTHWYKKVLNEANKKWLNLLVRLFA